MRRLIALSFAALDLVGCQPKPHERANVLVSVFPLYDLVRRIAGPDADVTLVLPRGASPETWAVTALPADVSNSATRGGLFVSVGLGVDPWMDALAAKAPPKRRVLKLGDRVPTLATEDGAIDGYVWMDPQRARLMATAIAEDLSRTDSSHARAFRDRASALDASLGALDKEVEAQVAAWPTHDVPALPKSMAYFAERYGLVAAAAAPASGAPDARIDALGADAKVGTYEDLIRLDAAALGLPRR